MSDQITAKGSDSTYKPHPDGQFVAVCVDTIDLGDRVEQFQNQPAKLTHKCAIVFRTGERNESTGEFIDIAKEFTVSMSDKANLRKFLEQWRGAKYTPEQVEQGVPLHKLTGNGALLTVERTTKNDKTYANIAACVGIPKQMRSHIPSGDGYVRGEWWTKKKTQYAEGAAKYRADSMAPDGEFDETQAQDESPDDLPF